MRLADVNRLAATIGMCVLAVVCAVGLVLGSGHAALLCALGGVAALAALALGVGEGKDE